jgi:hypothetical protein
MPKSTLPGSNSPLAVASRRALLAGAAGAAGALAMEAVAKTPKAVANTGDAVLAGKANNRKHGARRLVRSELNADTKKPGSAGSRSPA